MFYHEIILVDDDSIINAINTIIFKRMGIDDKVQSFQNPLLALDKLRSFNGEDVKRLIFLDINMPEMTGFEFLEFMEAENFPTSMEVIILTSSDSLRDKEEAKKYTKYVKGFISKPLRVDAISHYFV